MKKIICALFLVSFLDNFVSAQSNNVQSAWRALQDYNTSKKEGQADVSYLMKAKEKIDLAREHPDTKDKPKTLTYTCQVYYALFGYNWDQEKKKLSATLTNKSQIADEAYGNVSLVEFEVAGNAMEKVMLAEQNQSEKPYTMELMPIAMNMFGEMQNLAVGRFKVKKYEEAMDLFDQTYQGYKMAGRKDTNLIINAMLSAERASKFDKVIEIGKMMKEDKVANAETYNKIHFAYLNKKDTTNAEAALKEGLSGFPNDKGLILNYINIFLQQKKEAQAMEYIDKAIEKDPGNCALYIVKGNVYDNQANPKSPITGKDTIKPVNFNELMAKTEECYLKAAKCNPEGFENNFNAGAMYNNWGNWYSQNATGKTAADYDKKAQQYWMNAITYLEKCNQIVTNDKGLKKNLMRLYRMTSQTDKANAINEELKK
jgi:tetratricopeptide (TPR) repeat protein